MIVALVQKQRLVRLPFYGADPYQSTSVLALRALDLQAAPLCPELLPIAQDPSTRWIGMLSLLAIGTNSIPTLEKACQSTNIQVRQEAVLMRAMQKLMPPPWFSWGWSKAPINGKPLFELGYVVPEQDVGEMVRMLEHSDPAVRRASADAIGLYTRSPYTAVARSAVPLLIQATKDRDQTVSRAAGETLKKIDPEAAARAGVK
jgi:HEAT repeat protein